MNGPGLGSEPAAAEVHSRDVAGLGQIFTPPVVVDLMLGLRRQRGRVLEPAAGDGAFSRRIKGCVAIECDPGQATGDTLVGDFFACPESEQFATIIGNPPYVRYQDIAPATRALIEQRDSVLDKRANLYLYFIEKCLRHLAPGGELIFITPRDFLKTTSAVRPNRLLYASGPITDAIQLGEAPVFADAVPNCLIWRFERDDFSRQTRFSALAKISSQCHFAPALAALQPEMRRFSEVAGHLLFAHGEYALALSDVAFVKVGAVSGADPIYADPAIANRDFVCSSTERTGTTRRMLWCAPGEGAAGIVPPAALAPYREQLIARRVRPFDQNNWWEWGRGYHLTRQPRVYVNGKTRHARPFFRHPCLNYDGALLAIFPPGPAVDIADFCAALNDVDWSELGFVCDGRHQFTQRSLENAPLPESFRRFVPAASGVAGPVAPAVKMAKKQ